MLAAYKGKSFWPSKCIEWMSWSDYSHVGWLTEKKTIIEAWSPKVREMESVNSGHTPGTEIDLFDVPSLCPCDQLKLEDFLRRQLGKPYDYASVFRFIPRIATSGYQGDKWFCSELIMAAFSYIRLFPLKRIPGYKVTPGMLVTSPIFEFKETILTGEQNGY